MIEVERYEKIPKDQRFCPTCENIVEDEFHAKHMILHYALQCNPNLLNYNTLDKFHYLMTYPTGRSSQICPQCNGADES